MSAADLLVAASDNPYRISTFAAKQKAAGGSSKEIQRYPNRRRQRGLPPTGQLTHGHRHKPNPNHRRALALTIETVARNLRWSMATVSLIERRHSSNCAMRISYRDYLTNRQTTPA